MPFCTVVSSWTWSRELLEALEEFWGGAGQVLSFAVLPRGSRVLSFSCSVWSGARWDPCLCCPGLSMKLTSWWEVGIFPLWRNPTAQGQWRIRDASLLGEAEALELLGSKSFVQVQRAKQTLLEIYTSVSIKYPPALHECLSFGPFFQGLIFCGKLGSQWNVSSAVPAGWCLK